jgi:Undecaprenyl-phosphate glucose phosphotransferase
VFKRFQRFYTSIKVAADVVMIAVAFGLAYFLRFDGPFPANEGVPSPSDSWTTLAMALVIFPVTFRQTRLYATNRARTHWGEVFEIFKACVSATLILVALTYFARDRYSRGTLGLFVALAFVLVSTTRLVFRQVLNEVRKRGYNLKSILIIGAGELGERVIETIESHRELGFVVTGVLSHLPFEPGMRVLGVPVLDRVEEVERVLDAVPVDQVIIALPIEQQPLVKLLMEQLALRTVDVKVVPDLFQYMTLYGGFEEFGGLPIINLQTSPLDGWSQVLKRSFDIGVSLLALILLSPVMLVTALLVRLGSKGPVLFRQERMGMDGRTFSILKFRTMRIDAESAGAQMASPNDPRRTAIGAFLRASSIDELPQLINVLVGDMSLVGPRPERPVFITEFKQQIPKYHLRHKVKAGITGWAQVNGLRGQTSIQKRIEYDLYYIENWSLVLDLKILVRTALGGFISRNAY